MQGIIPVEKRCEPNKTGSTFKRIKKISKFPCPFSFCNYTKPETQNNHFEYHEIGSAGHQDVRMGKTEELRRMKEIEDEIEENISTEASSPSRNTNTHDKNPTLPLCLPFLSCKYTKLESQETELDENVAPGTDRNLEITRNKETSKHSEDNTVTNSVPKKDSSVEIENDKDERVPLIENEEGLNGKDTSEETSNCSTTQNACSEMTEYRTEWIPPEGEKRVKRIPQGDLHYYEKFPQYNTPLHREKSPRNCRIARFNSVTSDITVVSVPNV